MDLEQLLLLSIGLYWQFKLIWPKWDSVFVQCVSHLNIQCIQISQEPVKNYQQFSPIRHFNWTQVSLESFSSHSACATSWYRESSRTVIANVRTCLLCHLLNSKGQIFDCLSPLITITSFIQPRFLLTKETVSFAVELFVVYTIVHL